MPKAVNAPYAVPKLDPAFAIHINKINGINMNQPIAFPAANEALIILFKKLVSS